MPLPGFVAAGPRLRRRRVPAVTTHRPTVMTVQPRRPLKAARAVVVGAGPAGLCSAFMLAELGFKDVIILERSLQPNAPSRTGGYSFGIVDRGKKLLRVLPGAMDCIRARASVGTNRKVVISEVDGFKYEFLPAKDVVYVIRDNLLAALREALAVRHPELKVRWGASVVGIKASTAGGAEVTFVDGLQDGAENVVEADLVLGCDGSNSAVRRAIEGRDDIQSTRGFGLQKIHSASVGLAFGVLTSIPSPTIQPPSSEYEVMDKDLLYAAYGLSTQPPNRRFNLVFFPMNSDPDSTRNAVIVLKPEHDLWKVKDAEEFYAILEDNFPHVRIREIFSRDSLEKFLSQKIGHFPSIQRPMSLSGHFSHGDWENASSRGVSGGVILLGDAAHAFPPDLGQGLNGALEDVYVLKSIIEGCSEDGTINSVLEKYEEERDEDIWALMNMMQYGNPYQYFQNVWGLRYVMANFSLRSRLAKLAPKVFYPSVSAVSSPIYRNSRYREIWARAEATTRRIWGLAALIVALLLVLIKMLLV